jgi:hypothetical protein
MVAKGNKCGCSVYSIVDTGIVTMKIMVLFTPNNCSWFYSVQVYLKFVKCIPGSAKVIALCKGGKIATEKLNFVAHGCV